MLDTSSVNRKAKTAEETISKGLGNPVDFTGLVDRQHNKAKSIGKGSESSKDE